MLLLTSLKRLAKYLTIMKNFHFCVWVEKNFLAFQVRQHFLSFKIFDSDSEIVVQLNLC